MKWEALLTILSTIFALCFVLVVAYITIKWMSTKMSGHKSSRVIKIIDRVVIGQDKCLIVVRVGEQNMFIGMSGSTIVKLGELPELDTDTWQQGDASSAPEFADILQRTLRSGVSKLKKREDEQG